MCLIVFNLDSETNGAQLSVFSCYISLVQRVFFKKSKQFCDFIDYEKAFETIIHDALWIKLVNTGLSCTITTIIKAL